LASYARHIETFDEAGLQIVAVAADPVVRNLAMVEKLLLPFPVLADVDTRVIQEWGVYVDPGQPEGGIARPAVFVVEPDWSLSFAYVGSEPRDRPLDQELLAARGGERGEG
jgi:peroxiredoxin